MVLEPFPSFSFPLFSSTAPRGNPFLDPYLSLDRPSLPLSPSISLFRYARVSYFLPVPISLKCQAHEQSEIRRYKRRCPLYYVCFI